MTREKRAAELIYVLGKLDEAEKEISTFYGRNNIDYVDILEYIFHRRQTRERIELQLFNLEYEKCIKGVL